MRATPDQRDTGDLLQSLEELRDAIVEHTRALVNTGCVIALAHSNEKVQDEAKMLILEMNKDVHEFEEINRELAERGQ